MAGNSESISGYRASVCLSRKQTFECRNMTLIYYILTLIDVPLFVGVKLEVKIIQGIQTCNQYRTRQDLRVVLLMKWTRIIVLRKTFWYECELFV